MDNIGYEEFPKLTSESEDPSEFREERNGEDGAERRGRGAGGGRGEVTRSEGPTNPAPPVYAPPTAPFYPQEPPPAYSLSPYPTYPNSSCITPFHSTITDPFNPFPPPPPSSFHLPDDSGHVNFGVLVDPPSIGATEPPPDYLAPSIFNLIFCCIVFGLFAVVKSIHTRAAIQVGDYTEARVHSLEARNWNVAAAVTGGILWAMAILSVVVLMTI